MLSSPLGTIEARPNDSNVKAFLRLSIARAYYWLLTVLLLIVFKHP